MPPLEALADERRRDAVSAADLQPAIVGTELQAVHDRAQPLAHGS